MRPRLCRRRPHGEPPVERLEIDGKGKAGDDDGGEREKDDKDHSRDEEE